MTRQFYSKDASVDIYTKGFFGFVYYNATIVQYESQLQLKYHKI